MVLNYLTTSLFLLSLPFFASADSCSCYTTDNGRSYSKAAYFDFRQQTIPGASQDPSQTYGTQGTTQDGYLTSSDFTPWWSFQAFTSDASQFSPVNQQRDPANAYLAANTDSTTGGTSMLVLRTKQFDSFNSGAEMSFTHDQFLYGSFRYRSKITGDAGACAGFFTYLSDTQEADIEVLTQGGVNDVHFTNQPSRDANDNPIPDATTDFDMSTIGITKKRAYPPLAKRQAGQGWNGWRTWRLDWESDKTSFYIDGKKANDKSVNVPNTTSEFLLNIWSNGDPTWSGTMASGAEAYNNIEWIEFFYEETQATGCCNVDGSDDLVQNGYPVTNVA